MLHQQGQLAEAEKIYKKLLERAPDHPAVLNLLGVVACQNRDYQRAVRLISKAISINPNTAQAYSNLGTALKELGRFEEALLNHDKAIALKPDYAQAYYNRGIVLKELKRFEEALVSYEKSIRLGPDPQAYYNHGNVLKDLERFDEALASYDRAIALNPRFADAHFNRANALKHLGRIEEALASYRNAIELKPEFADAYYSKGRALQQLARWEEALACYEKVISLQANSFDAFFERANVLKELNRLQDALGSCDEAIALKPEVAEAHCNRGVLLRELGRAEEAHLSYQRAITLWPEFADAYNDMGLVLRELGQFEDGCSAFQKAIDIEPRKAAAYFNLADSKKFAIDDPHLIAMQELASAPDLSSAERMCLDFALGKANADIKDYRRSFQHLLAANSAKRASISYDEDKMFALFDSIETIFGRDLIEANAGAGDPSGQPIFILGMPRSGTSLVEQIVASHPAVYGGGELTTLRLTAQERRSADGATISYPYYLPDLDRFAFADIGARYLAELGKLGSKKERVSDKMLSNYYFIGLIHLALPNAKIIHTIRNPVDTCISCFSKLFATGQDFTYDLGELGRYHKRYERLMAHWRRVLPEGSILDVQYEDIVADLEAEARRILSYCELPWDDRCLSFHETDRPVRTASVMQVRQPIYKSAVGRWRDYEEFIGPLLTALGIQSEDGSLSSEDR